MDIEFDEDLDGIEEIDHAGVDAVRPYMYEPETEAATDDTDSTDPESDIDDTDPLERSGTDPVEWCTCGLCARMPTFLESGCCQENDTVKAKSGELQCITQHEGFIGNCLNIHVLEASYFEFVENEGYPLEDQFIQETYRYLAYRRFVRWVFHRLPKKMRKVLPACVVSSIRTRFPSETYCGFKYPTV